jgi:hypothetical protein
MYDFIGLLKNLFGLGQSALEYQSKKLDLNNTEGMKKAAAAQSEAAAVDKTHEAIAKKDLNELRREAAE